MKKEKVPIRPKQAKMRTDPEAETTQGENAESQSQPKNGVATTKVEYYENFDPTKSGISVTYPVVPEYSYLVSVAFNTEESCNK